MQNPFIALRPLVLASSSPRRQNFFQDQGLPVQIEAALLEEPLPEKGEDPCAYALRLAGLKAAQSFNQLQSKDKLPPKALIVAADTIVVPEGGGAGSKFGAILGKPAGPDQALEMLMSLAGRWHIVISACCLLEAEGLQHSFSDQAKVHFMPWSREVLKAYVACGDPLDKAGSYGLQGPGTFLVDRLEGSWSTVVGLPMHLLLDKLLELKAISPNGENN